MEASSTKAEPPRPAVAEPAQPGSGVLRKLRAGLLALLVLAALVWGYVWQKPSIVGSEAPGLAAWFLSPQAHPMIGSAPVVRGGRDGGFIPRGLCASSVDEAAEAACVVYPDGRLFLPRTDRGPRFVQHLARDPETGNTAALALDGALFWPLEHEDGLQWVEVVTGRQAREILPEPSLELSGHEGEVYSVAFSPDGNGIVSAGHDGTLRLWDATTGASLGEPLRGHENRVNSVAFSPDGSHIVSGGYDGLLRIWNVSSRAQLGVPLIGHDGEVYSVAFSPDGRRIASGSGDLTLRFWDPASREQLFAPRRAHVGAINSVAFAPDGSSVVSASDDHTLRLYDANTGLPFGNRMTGHEEGVMSVAFSPDGRRIISGSHDRSLRLWDAETGGRVGERVRGLEESAMSVAISPDGSRIASGSLGTVRLWDAEQGTPVGPVLSGHEGWNFVAFSPDGRRMVSGGSDGVVRVWDLATDPLPSSIAFDGSERLVAVGPENTLTNLSQTSSGPRWRFPREISDTERPFDLHSVHSHNGLTLAVGSDHIVVRETVPIVDDVSAGSLRGSWEEVNAFTDDDTTNVDVDLFSVHVGQNGAVWVAGDNGTVLFSENQGEEWSRQHAREGLRIDSLHIEDDGAGWASGRADGRPVWLHSRNAAEGNWRELNHLPAPWWFALLILGTPLALGANVRARVDTGPRVEQSIADRAVNDLPLDWSGVDALGLKSIARSLSRFLRNTDTKPPLTIAVTGRWGSGKSSLMNLLHLDLQRRGASTVWFNAWHHRSEDHLFAALMEAIRTEGVPSAWSVRGLGFRLRLLRHRNRQLVAGAGYLGILAAMALGFFLTGTWLFGLNLAEQIETFAELHVLIPDLEGLPSWLGSLPPLAIEAFGPILGFLGAGVALWLWVKATLPFPVKPAALLTEISSRTSVTGFSDRLGFRHVFGRALGEVATVMRRPTSAGLVIFIDDLDRCHPEHVLSVLEAVNFVVNAGPCIVVLGMDRQQVEHAVGLGFAKIAEGLPDADLGLSEIDGDADKDPKARENRRNALKREAYARRYMEKLVNLEVVIPTMRRTAVGLMVSGPQLGSDAEQTAAVHDPGKLHRRLLPFWNGLGWVLPRAGLAFLVAAALVFVTVPGPPRDATEAGGQLSPTESGVPDPPLPPDPGPPHPDPSPEPDPPEPVPPSPRGAPVPLQLAADPEAHPVPAWGIWLTAFVAMALLLLLVLSRLIASRATIRRDSPEFRRALAIVEPLLAREGVTPRDIRRWENRMRFLAESQRVEQQQTDSLEMVLERMGRLLGIALVASRTAQGEAVVPEPTLIALGALEFSFPDLTGAENAKPFSERLSGLESEGRNQLIQKSRAAFELEFTEQPLHYWPDDRAAAKYQQIRTGA